MNYFGICTVLLCLSVCAIAGKTCNQSSFYFEPATSLLQFRFKEVSASLTKMEEPLLPSPTKKSTTINHPLCRSSSPPSQGWSFCYTNECDAYGNAHNLMQSDCASVGGVFKGKVKDCGSLRYAGFCEPVHVSEKCLTRLSSFNSSHSPGQSCCTSSTQEAACLDGYVVRWPPGKKCALGVDVDTDVKGRGDANANLDSSSFANAAAFAPSMASASASEAVGARAFECIPSPVNANGRREEGMPGTEHRRRWRYDKDGTNGKTGSCCGLYSCSSCEENFAIAKSNAQCGFGKKWVCASQPR